MTPCMTPFTRSVYAVVAAIPSGQVTSSGAVAAILGRRPALRAGPQAPRAVGGALSAIPDELDLPWWRVISSSGRISTSSIHHTAQIQRALLEDDGVRFTETGRIDWDRYEWNPNDADLEQVLGTVDVGATRVGATHVGTTHGGATHVGPGA